MGNGFPAPEVEVGRIVFRSWEHEWQTGDRESFSLASAGITRAIYEALERWERDLLRSSLPYPPYGLRIRLDPHVTKAAGNPMDRSVLGHE